MKKKDYYEEIVKIYEWLGGKLENREELKDAMKSLASAEDLQVYDFLPVTGSVPFEKIAKKSKIPPAELHAKLDRLASEAFVFICKDEKGNTVYSRENPLLMTEEQIRKNEDTKTRTVFAKLFNTGIEGTRDVVKIKTPYFRVLPQEPTIEKSSQFRTIEMNIEVPNRNGVLPIDIVTELVRTNGDLIAVAACTCRKTRRILGKGCDYPLETCFSFNELAQSLVPYGYAREINYSKAIDIIRDCESKGLVHNVDNCEGKIWALCNCCPCCCAPLNNTRRRGPAMSRTAVSRYIIDFEKDKCKNCDICIQKCPVGAWSKVEGKTIVDRDSCVGCGLCVSACPSGACKLILRGKYPKIPKTHKKLDEKITREVTLPVIKRMIFGS